MKTVNEFYVSNEAKWLSVLLRNKWLWNWLLLQLLKFQIFRLFWARGSLTFTQLQSVNSLRNVDVTWQEEHTVEKFLAALLCFINLQKSYSISDSPWWNKSSHAQQELDQSHFYSSDQENISCFLYWLGSKKIARKIMST